VRQAKRLARNLVADLRGDAPVDYVHESLGAVAGLGIGYGVFQWRRLASKGVIAWLMPRGYHGMAMPMWERKSRVFGNWIMTFFVRRDIVALGAAREPRAAFREFAARPKG